MQHRKTSLVFSALLVFCICTGIIWAKETVVVGMVTETQGDANWQNDAGKRRVPELAELPENAKLVLAKRSKMTLVYLSSGQQYELNGPALVQFKLAKPVALHGAMPKMIGATPVLTEKTKIDPKKVQTASQTLVSTEAKEDANERVGFAAAPSPAPPPAAAPTPAMPNLIEPKPVTAVANSSDLAARERRESIQAHEAAERAVEAQMMAAKNAEIAASVARQSEIAAREAARSAAEAAAAKSQYRQTQCEPETGNKKTYFEKESDMSGKSIRSVTTDCPPPIIEQRN